MNTQPDPTRQTDLAAEFAAIAKLLCRCTVQVNVLKGGTSGSNALCFVKSGRTGFGSGIIWRPDGLIITNAHVAQRPDATVKLWDGRVFEAVVTARDPVRDLAALTLKAAEAA